MSNDAMCVVSIVCFTIPLDRSITPPKVEKKNENRKIEEKKKESENEKQKNRKIKIKNQLFFHSLQYQGVGQHCHQQQ